MLPLHWNWNSWEQKARENPFYAVMSNARMAEAGAGEPSAAALAEFYGRGRELAKQVIFPAIEAAQATGPVVEFGCGAGRLLNAVLESGADGIGLDVSPTMLKLCRRHVPGAQRLVLIGTDGRLPLKPASASVVYSYAVLQHINRLSVFERAVEDMARIVAPGGVLSIQTSCKDIANEECAVRGRTWNFERLSIYPRGPLYIARPNTTWFGVCIGYNRLVRLLQRNGLDVFDVSHPGGNLWSALFMARKIMARKI